MQLVGTKQLLCASK